MALKTVTVQSSSARQGYKVTMRALDTPGGALIMPYNPESYTVTPQPRWSARNIAGAEKDRSDWEGNGPTVISYSHLLTVQNAYTLIPGTTIATEDFAALTAVEGVILQLEQWATRPTLKTQRPTLIEVTMGPAFQKICHISSLSVRKVRTNDDGFATTAEIDLELTENE